MAAATRGSVFTTSTRNAETGAWVLADVDMEHPPKSALNPVELESGIFPATSGVFFTCRDERSTEYPHVATQTSGQTAAEPAVIERTTGFYWPPESGNRGPMTAAQMISARTRS